MREGGSKICILPATVFFTKAFFFLIPQGLSFPQARICDDKSEENVVYLMPHRDKGVGPSHAFSQVLHVAEGVWMQP